MKSPQFTSVFWAVFHKTEYPVVETTVYLISTQYLILEMN